MLNVIIKIIIDNIKAQKCYINNNFNIVDNYLLDNRIPLYLMSLKL